MNENKGAIISREEKNELWQWTAAEMTKNIKARKISSREVVKVPSIGSLRSIQN